jgi:tetratricopeptide (TPR) repeat protein
MSTLGGQRGTRMRRALLALTLVLDLCAANATLLTLGVSPAAAQQSEADVFVAQAILAYDAKRYDEALGLLKEALAQDPKNVEALYYSGLVLMAQQKTEQASATTRPRSRSRTCSTSGRRPRVSATTSA